MKTLCLTLSLLSIMNLSAARFIDPQQDADSFFSNHSIADVQTYCDETGNICRRLIKYMDYQNKIVDSFQISYYKVIPTQPGQTVKATELLQPVAIGSAFYSKYVDTLNSAITFNELTSFNVAKVDVVEIEQDENSVYIKNFAKHPQLGSLDLEFTETKARVIQQVGQSTIQELSKI